MLVSNFTNPGGNLCHRAAAALPLKRSCCSVTFSEQQALLYMATNNIKVNQGCQKSTHRWSIKLKLIDFWQHSREMSPISFDKLISSQQLLPNDKFYGIGNSVSDNHINFKEHSSLIALINPL